MNVGDRSLRVKVVMPFLFIALLTSGVFSAIAASDIPTANDTINWFNMVIQLLGGLALFLFGMEQMSAAIKAATIFWTFPPAR